MTDSPTLAYETLSLLYQTDQTGGTKYAKTDLIIMTCPPHFELLHTVTPSY